MILLSFNLLFTWYHLVIVFRAEKENSTKINVTKSQIINNKPPKKAQLKHKESDVQPQLKKTPIKMSVEMPVDKEPQTSFSLENVEKYGIHL